MYFHGMRNKIKFSVDIGEVFASIFKDLVPWCLHVDIVELSRAGGGGSTCERANFALLCNMQVGMRPSSHLPIFWKCHDSIS